MKFTLLGHLEAHNKRGTCTPTAPKTRQVLALLLVRSNQVIDTETLIEELWGARSPHSAQTTMQTYIYHLRNALREPDDPNRSDRIITKPSGYLTRVDEDECDMLVFERLFSEGKRVLGEGCYEAASDMFGDALNLWQGQALSGVTHGTYLQGYAASLEELRMNTLEMRIEADMKLGRHRELISELKALIVYHRYHELLYAQLMRALALSGRRHEALDVFQGLRHIMRTDLGLEPSRPLQHLQSGLLNDSLDPCAELEPAAPD